MHFRTTNIIFQKKKRTTNINYHKYNFIVKTSVLSVMVWNTPLKLYKEICPVLRYSFGKMKDILAVSREN